MIKGIGVDICLISRVDIYNQRFIERVLSLEEISIFKHKTTEKNKREYLAGRFAAKEALFKATGTTYEFNKISILNDAAGKPYANIDNCLVSISHDGDYAIGYVIVES